MSLVYFTLCLRTIKLEIVEVKLKKTILRGNRESTVFGNVIYYAFYQVPYAEPPLREFRFREPKPIQNWKKYLNAKIEYYGACAQGHIIHRKSIYGVEDCLYLNVYTPQLATYNKDNLKSVLVWFHGYGFVSSISHLYGPDFFILNDIVFVSVSYRIGPFGFLKTDDGSTDENVGLKDIIMSLKWVRNNIKKFGGDKTKITVMGFDSAGTMLALLLASGFKFLFSKLILHSSSMFSPSLFARNTSLETIRLRNLLMKYTLTDIDTAFTNDIIEAWTSRGIYSAKDITRFQRPVIPFTPTVGLFDEKSLFNKRPDELLKTHNFNIPILLGFNSQESISEIIPFLNNPLLLKLLEDDFKFMVPFQDGCSYEFKSKTYKRLAEIIKQKYFPGKIDEMSIKPFINYATDLQTYPIYHFIKRISKVNQNTSFVYKFNYRGQLNANLRTSTQGTSIQVNGTAKGDELCYLLRCEPLNRVYASMLEHEYDGSDKLLIKEVTTLWANFIKYGNPTPDNNYNYTWLPTNSTNNKILLIGNVRKMVTPTKENLMYKFWNNIYNDYYHERHCNEQPRDEL